MLRAIYRYANWLFFAYLAGGVAFLLLIESVFNGGFWESVKWLWLPLALAIFGFTWINREFLHRETGSRRRPWLVSLLLYPIAVLMTWPYVMAFNAATSAGEMMTYSGPIIRKWIQRGSRWGDSCQLDLRDTRSAQTVTLTVPPQRYASVSEGDVITAEFFRGGFGIPFRWRFAEP